MSDVLWVHRAGLTAGLVLGANAGCVPDEPLPPAPPSATGPVTSGATQGPSSDDGSEGTAETGAEDTCDPLTDPLLTCGPGMRCDVETLSCVAAPGAGVVDEPCMDDGDCAAPWVCGLEPLCFSLGIPDQPNAGHCGA